MPVWRTTRESITTLSCCWRGGGVIEGFSPPLKSNTVGQLSLRGAGNSTAGRCMDHTSWGNVAFAQGEQVGRAVCVLKSQLPSAGISRAPMSGGLNATLLQISMASQPSCGFFQTSLHANLLTCLLACLFLYWIYNPPFNPEEPTVAYNS